MTNDLAIWRGGSLLVVVILGLLVTAYLAYMAGYCGGYQAGATHYIVDVVDLYNKSNMMTFHVSGAELP
ncbi:hypothetical protein M0R72_17050 [Candidatus Pacearchaeota archaeon]|jgi:hypothetical protein|nr:hypothetical protein [Candidatus Pacearchaeota archaeon]